MRRRSACMTQFEVAEYLGITRQSVHEIEKRALAKLRKRLAHYGPEVLSEVLAPENNQGAKEL